MSGRTPSELDRWADAFDSAWNSPQTVSNLRCPTCSVGGELHLLYVLDEVEASHGMFCVLVWCVFNGAPAGRGKSACRCPPCPQGPRERPQLSPCGRRVTRVLQASARSTTRPWSAALGRLGRRVAKHD